MSRARRVEGPQVGLATFFLALAALTSACAPDGDGTPPSPGTSAGQPASGSDAVAAEEGTRTTSPPATSRAPAPSQPPAQSQAQSQDTPHATGADANGPHRWFVECATARGLDFDHEAGVSDERQLPETMGAGAALADLDADGDLDVYAVQSGPLPVAPAPPGGRPTNQLFENDGRGVFVDRTDASGDAAHDGYGMGVAVGDVNQTGRLDLLVTNLGPDVLLLNDGDLRFRDDTARAGLGDPRWTGSAAFFDADADGDLDLYVAAYVDVDLADPEWCGRRDPGWRSYCHPDAYEGLPDRFYRNRGDGVFEEVTVQAGLATRAGHHGKGLGVVADDLDGDLDLDLYIANDSVENRLWINDGTGHFGDGTLLSATGVNGRGLTEAGMGLASGDVDGDGDPELFVTNFDDESNTLYRNDGDGLFTDITARAGLDATSRLPVGFGTALADLDDDGDLDCAVTNGHIIDNIELYHDGKTHAQRGLLYTNDGAGHFADVSDEAGELCATPAVGRGLYPGDVDGDGDLDVLITVCDGRLRLFENHGPTADGPRRRVLVDGLPRHALVEASLVDGRTLWRRAGPQPSYFGQSDGRVHLGLGLDPGQGPEAGASTSSDGGALASLRVTTLDGHAWRVTFDPPLEGGRLAWTTDDEGPGLHVQHPSGTMTTLHPQPTDRGTNDR